MGREGALGVRVVIADTVIVLLFCVAILVAYYFQDPPNYT